jgi:hypothetical protein
MLSDRRKLAAATFEVCGVCALPFTDDELRWQVTFAQVGDAPLAERATSFSITPSSAATCSTRPRSRAGGRRRSDSEALVDYDDTAFAKGGVIGSELASGSPGRSPVRDGWADGQPGAHWPY